MKINCRVREKREKKEKGSVPRIHCMPERALETKLSGVHRLCLRANDSLSRNRKLRVFMGVKLNVLEIHD